ncbi:MAG: RNA polymerase-associated protein rapA [Candidatus Thiodiazotropha sp. (ex Monitilora ramsayi)]|nr:RNA polymerase-associated protein rapA [Candidatus Thiodiazotropha sp. (ex Monitilora ramsayi)]
MFKRCKIYQSILLALVVPGSAMAEIEITGFLKNETSVFTRDGQVTGEAETMLDERGHEKGDLLKFENSARVFMNGDIGEESTWHADLNFIYDSEGINSDYKGHKLYTQHDYLRELYLDSTLWDWDLRLGKQQVVWGTADGIKLLDIINPTDFRELNQNAMEDSRIPIWMINAERNIGNSGNVQFIVSQVEENKIPGLDRDGAAGHPFLMKGVDTITGEVNGFLHVAPALANVAGSFTNATQAPLLPGGIPNPLFSPLGLVPFSGLTVDGFASGPSMLPLGNPTGAGDLGFIAQCGLNFACSAATLGDDPNANAFVTNLMPVNSSSPVDTSYSPSAPTSAFEYMPMASFATFNTFAKLDPSLGMFTGATSEYVRDYPDDSDVNAGLRWKQSLDNGFNYSLNYFYHYSANPDVNLSWHDAVTGEKLTEQLSPAGDFIDNGTGLPGSDGIPDLADFTQSLTPDQLPTNVLPGQQLPVTTLLHNGAGEFYGAFDPTGGMGLYNPNPVKLRFTETLHRVHSIGTSFDYAIDAGDLPIVLRGEFLYDRNDKQPVIYRHLLAHGALASSLVMEDADYFKYVLGLDVTVMTNLLVSGQFIQFNNLDYVEENRTCTTQTGQSADCSTYTADFATLHLTNGLNMGYENKEFYSLFFSKPFGPSQEHRWNNITIYEEGGGKWNRFDVEYSFTDTLIGSAEWNHYWGDEDSTFGQFADSSNLQVGIKWLIE